MNRLEAMELARESDHCLKPAEAFAMIGNEIRVAILEALWHADEQPVGFTTLYERAGADNTSKFNYHLGQLTGHFVRKVDDGYELRTAGESVVRAAVEGSFNAHPDLDPIDTGDDCTRCGGPLVATYSDETFAIECPACGRTHGQYSFPPGGLIGRDDAETLSAFDQRVRHLHSLARDGVCPECSGQMRTDVVQGEDCCLVRRPPGRVHVSPVSSRPALDGRSGRTRPAAGRLVLPRPRCRHPDDALLATGLVRERRPGDRGVDRPVANRGVGHRRQRHTRRLPRRGALGRRDGQDERRVADGPRSVIG
ncbi:MAG: hypothetical protein A07HB70_01440 [uncultured archaeon A07HB70]|nr:MAG: hypothetical protein A07HB70_01440 [uncultured archaeon A07HB70]